MGKIFLVVIISTFSIFNFSLLLSAADIQLYLSDNYLEIQKSGTQIGENLSVDKVFTVDNKEKALFSSFKKSLVVFASAGCFKCQQYYPILKDWAKRYQDTLKITVVYIGQIFPRDIQELIESRIDVVTDYWSVKKIIDPGKGFFSFLVDECGKVVYRFSFQLKYWKMYDKIIKDFISNKQLNTIYPTVKKGLVIDKLELLNWIKEEFSNGSENRRPLLLFFLTDDVLSGIVKSFIIHMKVNYGNSFNIGIIYDNPGLYLESYKEYSRKFNYHLENIEEVENIEEKKVLEGLFKVSDKALISIPVFLNVHNLTDGEYFATSSMQQIYQGVVNYFNFANTPQMVVIDENMRLIDIFSFSTSNCCGYKGVNAEIVIDELMKSLETSHLAD